MANPNLLAFDFSYRFRLAWCATYRFSGHFWTVIAYVLFQDWDHLLRSSAAAAIRPLWVSVISVPQPALSR